MCGIIHCKRKNAKKLVIKRYEKQKNRGTQGYGFIEINNGIVIAETRTQNETEIMKKLNKSTANEIMFHHRTPTSTPNIVESTHPIKVSNPLLKYNYYVMHNGIITNDSELRTEQTARGFIYTTGITKKWITNVNTYAENLWNDSEAVAIDFALAIETGKEIIAKGSIAIVALQYEKETGKAIALYYGRNAGNPLCIENTKDFFCLSSETGKEIPANIMYKYDYKTSKISQENKKIGDYYTYTYDYKSEQYWDNYVYNTTSKKGKKGKKDMEENDFDMENYEEVCELEELIQQAYQVNDYDLAIELEQELYELKIEIENIESKTKALGF